MRSIYRPSIGFGGLLGLLLVHLRRIQETLPLLPGVGGVERAGQQADLLEEPHERDLAEAELLLLQRLLLLLEADGDVVVGLQHLGLEGRRQQVGPELQEDGVVRPQAVRGVHARALEAGDLLVDQRRDPVRRLLGQPPDLRAGGVGEAHEDVAPPRRRGRHARRDDGHAELRLALRRRLGPLDLLALDPDGVAVPDGAYFARVEALDATGAAVPAGTVTYGQVRSVAYTAGGLLLDLGMAGSVSLYDIRKIL